MTSKTNDVIIPVILAGGSGTRLWPISTAEKPKQFSRLISKETLFQSTLKRLTNVSNVSDPIIICNKNHFELAQNDLAEIGIKNATFILEPIGKNTAPAIAIAALEVLSKNKENLDFDPILLVLASDHVITNTESFNLAINNAQKYSSLGHLVCFGVTPRKPETGYGYIKIGEQFDKENAYIINHFVEKPNLATAERYLDSREYFWNSGMFMFRAKKYLKELKKNAADIFSACEKAFAKSEFVNNVLNLDKELFSLCRSDSVDYAVMEHTENSVVIVLDVGWNDLGSWNSLWEYFPKDAEKNVILGDAQVFSVENSYIHATKRKVVVVGVENCIVVETENAVLVLAKDKDKDIKKILDEMKL